MAACPSVGYVLDNTGVCRPCPDNCAKCSVSWQCRTCKRGYVAVENGTLVSACMTSTAPASVEKLDSCFALGPPCVVPQEEYTTVTTGMHAFTTSVISMHLFV